MQIKLINCNSHLLASGIDMSVIGADALLVEKLSSKFAILAWEYDFTPDTLLIDVEDGTIIPDMSDIGEVVPNDNSMG